MSNSSFIEHLIDRRQAFQTFAGLGAGAGIFGQAVGGGLFSGLFPGTPAPGLPQVLLA